MLVDGGVRETVPYPFSVKSVATKSSRLTYKTYLKIGIQSPWWMY